MCGICGMVGRPERNTLGRMALAMEHRGPDDDGFLSDHRLGIHLAHRRLSILDIGGGHQPMVTADESSICVEPRRRTVTGGQGVGAFSRKAADSRKVTDLAMSDAGTATAKPVFASSSVPHTSRVGLA